MYLTRSQLVGLFGLAVSLPVDARFDVTMPNEDGDVFIKAHAPSMPVPEGKEPMWRISPRGETETLRAPKKLKGDAGGEEL
jgi:hypothetical protein